MGSSIDKTLRDLLDEDFRAIEGRLSTAESWKRLTAAQRQAVIDARARAGRGSTRLAAAEIISPLPAPESPPSSTLNFGFNIPGLEWTARYPNPSLAFDYAKELGAGWVVVDLPWKATERSPGVYTWTIFDTIVALCTARGLKPLLGLDYNNPLYAATWNTGIAAGATANRNAYVAWATAAVNRYKTRGVTTYQIWNEPNAAYFWGPKASAADYTTLLKAVYPAMKTADPNCTVLGGATSASFTSPTAEEFITSMYAAGAGGYFDAISHHPYTGRIIPPGNQWGGWTQMIDTIRPLMVANRDGAKKIWVTEYGSPTGGTDGDTQIVTEEHQATVVTAAMSLWKSYPWAGVFCIYTLRDTIDISTASHEHWYGLLREDWSEKPGAEAYRAMSR